MPSTVRAAFEDELQFARAATDTDQAWHHLERAHVLSQMWVRPHVYSHWLMLRLAVRCRDRTEAVGQIIRVLASTLGWIRRPPEGNTGRTAVGLLTVMPIPDDLARILQAGRAEAVRA
ncbi:DUF3703 domain-containing protein [Nocardia mexicana]|nr:DUF3703 domain-containing protein [Nocardia mexicana]